MPQYVALDPSDSKAPMDWVDHALADLGKLSTSHFDGFVINPLVMNGVSHLYYLDESTFNFRGIRSNFHFYFIFR